MKKILIFIIGMMLFLQHGYSQQDCDIAIKAITITTPPDTCLPKGACVSQMVTVTNKGNVDVYDIPLELEIYTNSGIVQLLIDTLRGILLAGTSRNFTFQQCYYVPADTSWFGIVRAELLCDTNLQDNVDTIKECVNLDDIEIVRLISLSGHYDYSGTVINLEVLLRNLSPDRIFTDVNVNALISDGLNNVLLKGTIDVLLPGDTIYRFPNSYTVPAVNNYCITIFVDSVDNYQYNDTITVCRAVVPVGIKESNCTNWNLRQNIPNPAKNNTQIEYNIPSVGQVIFTLYNITGQILYVEKNDAASGKNKIELNTANLTNGVYNYAMEYNEERLVRKMTIQK